MLGTLAAAAAAKVDVRKREAAAAAAAAAIIMIMNLWSYSERRGSDTLRSCWKMKCSKLRTSLGTIRNKTSSLKLLIKLTFAKIILQLLVLFIPSLALWELLCNF